MSSGSGGREQVERQKSYFDREAGNYDRQFTRCSRRNHDAKMAALDAILGLGEAGAVLEVGAGSGMHLSWIAENRPEIRYVGVDLSHGMLREAKRKGLLERDRRLLTADALALPLAPDSFDAAFAVDVVHHVPDPVAMLREMARSVRPGARLAVLEPNWVFPVNLIYLFRRVEWGVFRSRIGNLSRWARQAGWKDIRPVRLPIFFPPFPEAFHGAYGAFERLAGAMAPVRYFSTTLGVAGRADFGEASTFGGRDPSSEA